MTVIAMPKPHWLSKAIPSDGKLARPLPNLYNCMLALREDAGLKDMLQFNEFACCPEMIHPINEPMNIQEPSEVRDADLADIQSYLQDAGLKQVSVATVQQAVNRVAQDVYVHPVRAYLSSLPLWDGVNRLDNWLARCAGCDLNTYTSSVGRWFLMGMVARILDPGCKMDYMIVLEGPQGKLKSTLLRTLVGDDWFSDHLPDIGSKDSSIHLRGKWLIEVAEMHTFSRAESTALKSFLSRQEERYRRPFERCETYEKRQCVFAGTTNKDTYLKDETGNRRFWPLRCVGTIDLDDLDHIRDQLFSEAMHRFNEDEHYWPDGTFERDVIKPEQDQRYDADCWEDQVLPYLDGRDPLTLTEIAVGCLGYSERNNPYDPGGTPINQFGTAQQNRLRNILKSNGWVRDGRDVKGRMRWKRN